MSRFFLLAFIACTLCVSAMAIDLDVDSSLLLDEETYATLQDAFAAEQDYVANLPPLAHNVALLEAGITTTQHSISENAATPNFNVANAVKMFMLAAAPYCDHRPILDWSCSFCKAIPGFEVDAIVYSAKTNMLGYVGHHATATNFMGKPFIAIAFKGTNPKDIRDLMVDANFIRRPVKTCTGCEVHGGFLDAWQSVQGEVMTSLKEVIKSMPGAPIYLTGHSLGGAVATVAAAHFRTNAINDVPKLWTFGSPRVGNDAFAQYMTRWLGAESVRVTHEKDIVVHLPLRFIGFSHVANEYWFDANANTYFSCVGIEDPKCSNSEKPAISIADHLSYVGIDLDKYQTDKSCRTK